MLIGQCQVLWDPTSPQMCVLVFGQEKPHNVSLALQHVCVTQNFKCVAYDVYLYTHPGANYYTMRFFLPNGGSCLHGAMQLLQDQMFLRK